MSEGLDPLAGLSAGSCLVNRASVSLGSVASYATKCAVKGVKFYLSFTPPKFLGECVCCMSLHSACVKFKG